MLGHSYMKLSLSWIFEHIYADWQAVDVEKLISQFIKTIAEIEGYEKYQIALDSFALAQVKHRDKATTLLACPEWQTEYAVPAIADARDGQWFMIKKNGNTVRLAHGGDFGSAKDSVLPALAVADYELDGSWKKSPLLNDYIIYLDNKSVNHRPDMWGHRGVAREIAALLNLPLKPLAQMVAQIDVQTFEHESKPTKENPFMVRIENQQVCRRIAAMHAAVSHFQETPLALAITLLKVDARPINALIDLTNFVMLDIGQPMHAFDAQKISSQALVVRSGKQKEELVVLDGATVLLTPEDTVITDGIDPISLAGISGGKATGVTEQTRQLILESGSFDAATIRRTAARLKRRTDSSTRFEKSLDPNQTVVALQRYVHAARQFNVALETAPTICVVGQEVAAPVITVTHQEIEQMIGTSIKPEFIVTTLHALEFGVQQINDRYTITIPTYRATKDISAAHDIAEEIVRFIGYENIPLTLPVRSMKPFSLTSVEKTRAIKRQLAFGSSMHELYTYAFFDESFLRILKWEPINTLQVQSAVSENWQRLVTSLIPNLLKAAQQELGFQDQVRFFESARIWHAGGAITEKKSLAGIIADRKQPVDFYECKLLIENLLHSLGISCQWLKVTAPQEPWYMPYQTAHILVNDTIIGTAGKAHPAFYEPVALGQAFLFELDMQFLLDYKAEEKKITPPAKYPAVERDISMLVPLSMTVDHIKKIIKSADTKISSVLLVDFFEKAEWHNQKSITCRFVITDAEKTLTHQEADAIWEIVAQRITDAGGVVR